MKLSDREQPNPNGADAPDCLEDRIAAARGSFATLTLRVVRQGDVRAG